MSAGEFGGAGGVQRNVLGGQLVEVRLHADAADHGWEVLWDMRSGCALVVTQAHNAGTGEGLGDQPAAAVVAGKQGRVPVAIGRSASGDQHHARERAGAVGARQ